MAYSAAILQKAQLRLAQARQQCEQDDRQRIGAIYERLPRLRQIDLSLQKTAAKVCAAAFRARKWTAVWQRRWSMSALPAGVTSVRRSFRAECGSGRPLRVHC